MKFDLPAEAIEHRDAILGQVIEAGVPEARGRAILDDYGQDMAMAGYRLVRRLDLATRACEAMSQNRRHRLSWCDQPATTMRDGHRACQRHARGAVEWELARSQGARGGH